VTDNDELARFCAEAHPQLVAALAHQFGDRWLAEELAQEALIRACDRWDRVRTLSSPIGWTFRVGVNLGSSWFRRRGAEQRARRRYGAAAVDHHDADVVDRILVERALSDLTPAQRQVIVMRYFLGLSAEETAQATDSTAGAIRGLTFRAIRVLRDHLDMTLDEQEAADAS
jgi:RNA polymerase sigma factor (sigma-70 family)